MPVQLDAKSFKMFLTFWNFVIFSDHPVHAMETTSHTHSLTDLFDKVQFAKPAHDVLALIVATVSLGASELLPSAEHLVGLLTQTAVAGSTVLFMLAGVYLRFKESRLAERRLKHLEELKLKNQQEEDV